MTDNDLWAQVWDMLAYHAKGLTLQHALRRLIAKHFRVRFEQPVPKSITIEVMRPRLEHWTTEQLDQLWRGHERTEVMGSADLPIIVLRLPELDCLIDGNTRINKRVAAQVPGTHPVIVLDAAILMPAGLAIPLPLAQVKEFPPDPPPRTPSP